MSLVEHTATVQLIQIIVTVKKYKYLKHNKYYITIYKCGKDAETGAFVMSCHVHASKPIAATYYQTDPKFLKVIKSNIEEDKLSSEIRTFLYKQQFQKQCQAETGKKSGKS